MKEIIQIVSISESFCYLIMQGTNKENDIY